MPRKMVRFYPPTAVQGRGRDGIRPHRPPVLREGQKNANIHAKMGFIWGIPGKKTLMRGAA